MTLRKLICVLVACAMTAGTTAHAGQTTDDEVFANAALRSLHGLSYAFAQYEQATNDSDQLGCHDAYVSMQKFAHEALIDMHSMSFSPVDAIKEVPNLLRLIENKTNECSDKYFLQFDDLIVGQAIIELRYDYSIGDGDWYTIIKGVIVEAKNPLQYAQSLQDQNYSWVNVRPKGMIVMVESNWKAEWASNEVDDPSIENSGSNLKAVEVDYRKNSGDNTTLAYFYRTKADAKAAMQAANRQADADAKANAELNASKTEWNKKLASVPYMVADDDVGFKLVYGVCKDTGQKDSIGVSICTQDDSHDWSDSRGAPYHWFSDFKSCEYAEANLNDKKQTDVKINGRAFFVSDCVPAPRPSGYAVKGYEAVIALVAPGATNDNALYAELRKKGFNTATVFRTFKACYNAMVTAYPKALKDLGIDKDGNLVGDKTENIDLTADCVRAY